MAAARGSAESNQSKRLAAIGWGSWSIAALIALFAASSASVQRRIELCTAGGAESRAWIFRLVPLGQTCGNEISPPEMAVQVVLTALAAGGVIVGVVAVVLLVARRGDRLPTVARWLVYAVCISIALAFIGALAVMLGGHPYMERDGVSLELTWNITVGFALGLTVTAAVGLFRAVLLDGVQQRAGR